TCACQLRLSTPYEFLVTFPAGPVSTPIDTSGSDASSAPSPPFRARASISRRRSRTRSFENRLKCSAVAPPLRSLYKARCTSKLYPNSVQFVDCEASLSGAVLDPAGVLRRKSKASGAAFPGDGGSVETETIERPYSQSSTGTDPAFGI